jgi:hypothetical protein
MIWNAFAIAVREIGRNLTRAFLTVLGIFIGVAAIITMVTLGQGATLAVKAQIASLGSNLLTVRPGAGFGSRASSAGVPHFTEQDAVILGEQIASIASIAPVRTARGQPQQVAQDSLIAFSTASRDWPVRFWMRPSSSSCFPATYCRSSSVRWAHFCLSLPFAMFQSPLISSVVMGFSCLQDGVGMVRSPLSPEETGQRRGAPVPANGVLPPPRMRPASRICGLSGAGAA